MEKLKPKEQHEQALALADKERIVEHLNEGRDQEVNKIAVTLAHQCHLFVHFQRLWRMRIIGLDEKLGTDQFMKSIYENKRALYKQLVKSAST